MEHLTFQYPLWWLIFGVAGAALMCLLMYGRAAKLDEKKPWLSPLLWLLRFIPIFTIAFLLLGPLLKRIVQESKKPTIVIIEDHSQSVDTWATKSSTDLSATIGGLPSQLSDQYEVSRYAFGADVSFVEEDSISVDDQITDISKALSYVHDIYEGENLGAIILATDGIYNTGQNPLYTSIPQNIPIYSIALGDTSKIKDASVKTVLHNEVAYLNDEMLTQVDISVTNGSGTNLQLTVERESTNGWQKVRSENIRVTSEDFFVTKEIQLAFDRIGIDHYRYSISGLNKEANRANNRKDVYIQVLDARQNIRIIAQAPHPDLSALKQILEQNKNYQISINYQEPSPSELSETDMVILHNLPSTKKPVKDLLRHIDERRTPRMYIVGQTTNLALFNQSQNLMSITGSNGSVNNASANIEKGFSSFTISEELRLILDQYPPLASPYGTYAVGGNVNAILSQSIGDIKTDYPLLAFADVDGVKSGFLLGNDIWRWKLFDYLQYSNFDRISELVDKSITYLTTKEDKRKFRVHANDNVYMTNDDIILTGELYNSNYELINDPEVTVQITTEEGAFDYSFSRTDQAYQLNIGQMPAGRYSYRAKTLFNGESYQAEGRYVVREVQYELYDLQARHDILYGLSDKTNGSVNYPEDLTPLITTINESTSIKPVIYQSALTKPLIDSRWLFGLLVLPLMLEWFLRRYFGSL